MAVWPIHLPTHAVYKHFSSQYVVFGWCDIVWAQGYLGHSGFLPCTAVVLSTALWPYIFHVISIKGTWYFLVTNQKWSNILTEGILANQAFLMTAIVGGQQREVLNINMWPCVKVTSMAHPSYFTTEKENFLSSVRPYCCPSKCISLTADTNEAKDLERWSPLLTNTLSLLWISSRHYGERSSWRNIPRGHRGLE